MNIREFQDTNTELPEPWYWCDIDLTKQLAKEISNDHILFAKILKTIAKRQDNDDVLFEIENDPFKYAVVHLSWSKVKQTDKRCPSVKLYKDWDDLYRNRLLVDKVAFEE